MLFFWVGAAALAAIVVAAVVLATMGGDGQQGEGIDADTTPVVVSGDRAEVLVIDSAFKPAIVKVPQGATVAWTWDGNLPHNVEGDGFESDTQTDGTFEFTFEDEGTYDYECTVHPGMDGRVVVGAQ